MEIVEIIRDRCRNAKPRYEHRKNAHLQHVAKKVPDAAWTA